MKIERILRENLTIVDVESNGLWGQPFAVGAVRMTSGGRILQAFRCRCNIDEVPDEWIIQNKIEEKLSHFPLVENQKELIKSFYNWFKDYSRNVFVDCGFPVDCGFLGLYKLLNENQKKNAPYPLYDVSSIMLAAGEHPLTDRLNYAKELIGEKTGVAHDPVWDAEVSGLCAIRAMRKLQALHGEG